MHTMVNVLREKLGLTGTKWNTATTSVIMEPLRMLLLPTFTLAGKKTFLPGERRQREKDYKLEKSTIGKLRELHKEDLTS